MPETVTLNAENTQETVSVDVTQSGVVEISVVAEQGAAATIEVGTTTTSAAGGNASVVNSGTDTAAVFDFTIPRGAAGPNSVTSATTSDGTATLNTSTLTTGTLTVSTSGVFNATSYTFGTGAASAFKTALAITASNISDFNSAASSAAPVQSVAGRTGAVTIASADITNATNANTGSRVALRDGFGGCSFTYVGIQNAGGFAGQITSTNLTANYTHQQPNAAGTYCLTSSTTGVPNSLANATISGTVSFSGGADASWRSALSLTSLATTAPGTGVTTALAVNVGTAGAFVVNGGALGTPSSGTLTSCTGLPISTGVSGLGTNVATFLATPTSANLLAAVTDETGSGSLVFSSSPTITTPTISGAMACESINAILSQNAATRITVNNANTGTSALADLVVTAANGVGGSNGFAMQVFGSGYTPTWDGLTLGKYMRMRMEASNMLGMIFTTGGANPIFFGTADVRRMTIAGTGEIGMGTTSPSTAAVLDLSSTTKGFLPPRMTTAQRNAITSPPAGLMIYNTNTNKLNVYTTAWEAITSA